MYAKRVRGAVRQAEREIRMRRTFREERLAVRTEETVCVCVESNFNGSHFRVRFLQPEAVCTKVTGRHRNENQM